MYLNNLERELYDLLVTVGCIHRNQIYYFFIRNDREIRREVVDGVILSLVKKHLAYTKDKEFFTININMKVDYYMIDAIWVLLQSKNEINWETLMTSDAPSQLLYVKNGSLYEIMSVKDKEEYKYLTLIKKHLSNCAKKVENDVIDESIKYIIVVPHESYVKNIPTLNLKYIVAIINYNKDDNLLDIPNISIYTRG